MADNDEPADDAPAQPEADERAESPNRADVPAEVTAALRKANKEAEKLRLQLREYQDRDKTEAERVAEKAAEAERRAAAAEQQLLRRDVALAKGLPRELALRLQGDTQEEMEADADALLGLLGNGAKAKGAPDLGQGARGRVTAPPDMNSLIRQRAGRQ